MEALILKLLPMLITLLNEPALRDLLRQAGQAGFPEVPRQQAPDAAVALLDRGGTKWLQTGLNLCGYKLDVDGIYGPATRSAVSMFQETHKLVVDGWAGDATTAAIQAELLKRNAQ